jgi:hypothetical protein
MDPGDRVNIKGTILEFFIWPSVEGNWIDIFANAPRFG